MKDTFDKHLSDLISTKNYNSVYMSEEQYNNIIKEVCEAKTKTKYKSDRDYRRLRRYDVLVVGKEKRLISPINEKSCSIKYYASVEKFFDIIHNAHLNTGHGGRNRIMKEINENYKNITIEAVMLYLSLCEPCQKKAKGKKKGLVVKSILASELNSRCQIDLIDLQTQPDGDYKFVLNYQDHLTKFVILKALKSKTAVEVAYNVMEIFTTFGAPSIIQSDNGREFVNKIISELVNLWTGIKIIHGKPRHSQSQGSVERANQDVQNMIFTWMETNKSTKWSEGLKYVQLMKNRSFHEGIKQTPYEALFGTKMKLGLKSSSLPPEIVDTIETEEELATIIRNTTTDSNVNEEASIVNDSTEDVHEENNNDNDAIIAVSEENAIILKEFHPPLDIDDMEIMIIDQVVIFV